MAETREEALAALVKWLRKAQVACEWQAPTPQMLSAQIADRIETALALPETADRPDAPPSCDDQAPQGGNIFVKRKGRREHQWLTR